MARKSNETAQMFQNAYDKSKEFIGTVKQESRVALEEARRWVPEHPNVIATSASVALCAGVFGYALGRRRARAVAQRSSLSAAIDRAPELDFGPFFRFAKLWMLYRIAAKA
jgi:hypothetical protein